MRIILIGPPGAGKGTQARQLAHHLEVPHFSPGEILRQQVAMNTALGRSVQHFITQGQLAPDDIMREIVERWLGQPDCAEEFLLDGFPRTVSQAKQLQTYLDERDLRLAGVIELHVEAAELLRRTIARGRADDKSEVIQRRLNAHQRETEPLLNYYDRRKLLHRVDGLGAIEEVFQRLLQTIGRISSRPLSMTADIALTSP